MSITDETMRLHNGIRIPTFGLDTIHFGRDHIYDAVRDALANGIRHVETAADYGTEAEIGRAVRDSGIPRSDLFITDEIIGINHPEATARSAQASIRRMGLDYLDLLLMSWNGGKDEKDPANRNVYKAWKGLESLYKSGNVHAIGLVDFDPWQIEYLLNDVEIAPMVAHLGLFPGHPDIPELNTNDEHGILTLAYMPRDISRVIDSRELEILAEKHRCTGENITMQYLRQKNCAVTIQTTRLEETGFTLSEEEMAFLDVMRDYTV